MGEEPRLTQSHRGYLQGEGKRIQRRRARRSRALEVAAPEAVLSKMHHVDALRSVASFNDAARVSR
jgi:hypothetical protein